MKKKRWLWSDMAWHTDVDDDDVVRAEKSTIELSP